MVDVGVPAHYRLPMWGGIISGESCLAACHLGGSVTAGRLGNVQQPQIRRYEEVKPSCRNRPWIHLDVVPVIKT